jgi:hypothetical protein
MKMWRDGRDHHDRGSDGGTHELQPPYSPSHSRVSEAKTKAKDTRSCDLYAIDLMSPRLQVIYTAQHLFHGRLNATKSSLSRHRAVLVLSRTPRTFSVKRSGNDARWHVRISEFSMNLYDPSRLQSHNLLSSWSLCQPSDHRTDGQTDKKRK